MGSEASRKIVASMLGGAMDEGIGHPCLLRRAGGPSGVSHQGHGLRYTMEEVQERGSESELTDEPGRALTNGCKLQVERVQ